MTEKTAPPSIKGAESGDATNLDMLMDVSLQVAVELGRTRMTVRQLLDLQNGSVIELDRMAGDVVDVYINDRLLARGEVVVVDDKFGVRITELISPIKSPGEAAS
jgi:flagellar motor switch protein FliN